MPTVVSRKAILLASVDPGLRVKLCDTELAVCWAVCEISLFNVVPEKALE